MNFFIIYFILALFSPINKYDAKSNFNYVFDKNYEMLKINISQGIINIFETEKKIRLEGEIKLYHRDPEKANLYLKNIKFDSKEEGNLLNLFINYSKDKTGREAKKLAKLFIINLYVPKELSIGIYLKKGEVYFKNKQERNIVIEGWNLIVSGSFSKNYKKIEAYNYFGDLNISGKNLIKRYLFPFGKKVIYLNPYGEVESFIKVYKGNIKINLEK